MNGEHVTELLGAYALDALDPDEQAKVEEHLRHCADCRLLAAEFARVAASLPQALAVASGIRPPVALKAQLLQAIESSAQQDEPQTRNGATGYVPRRRSSVLRRWQVLFPLAAAMLIVILGTGLTAVLAREQALRAELAKLTSQQELILEVIDSPKTTKVLMRPPAGSASTAYGKLYTRLDMADVVAMAARLPQPSAGQGFHLWISSAGKTELAGVLTVNAEGFGLLTFRAPQQGPAYDTVKLTLQPLGSAAPIDRPVLLWEAAR
jgi:anti-sigma factor RsiW